MCMQYTSSLFCISLGCRENRKNYFVLVKTLDAYERKQQTNDSQYAMCSSIQRIFRVVQWNQPENSITIHIRKWKWNNASECENPVQDSAKFPKIELQKNGHF